jgi:hypothetical protein
MRTVAILAALALAGCASFGGSGLEPGRANEAQVVSVMGQPAQRLPLPGGGSALYYPRLPDGRQTFVAVLGADGVLKSIERRLTPQEFRKVVPGMSADAVRELLGPPASITRMERHQRDVWEYPWLAGEEKRVLWVQFSYDGKVREVVDSHDFYSDPPSGPLT